jgi:hypothetical protein
MKTTKCYICNIEIQYDDNSYCPGYCSNSCFINDMINQLKAGYFVLYPYIPLQISNLSGSLRID